MSKVVEIRKTYGGSIIELSFVTIPRRGWFKDNIQPIVDVMKVSIPSSSREYNADSRTWSIAAEFWPVVELILQRASFSIKDLTKDFDVQMPEGYAENFHYAPTSATPVESKESIAEQLAKILELPKATLDSSTEAEIKNFYKKAARKHHPDLGGDAAVMSELNRLWTIYNSTLTNA